MPNRSSPPLKVFKLSLELREGVQSRVTNSVICTFSKHTLRALSQALGETAVNKRQNPILVGLRVCVTGWWAVPQRHEAFKITKNFQSLFFANTIPLIFGTLKLKEITNVTTNN